MAKRIDVSNVVSEEEENILHFCHSILFLLRLANIVLRDLHLMSHLKDMGRS